MKKKLKNLTAVIGGAASGKSGIGEKLVLSRGSGAVYIATAQAFDSEMQRKIEEHQKTRGPGWETHEAPLDLCQAVENCRAGDAVLIDCATMWLSNLMLAEKDVDAAQEALWHALAQSTAEFVVVSNEVGAGIVPENALAREFRNLQGRFNQSLAAHASQVIGVMAGCPFALKGALPDTLKD